MGNNIKFSIRSLESSFPIGRINEIRPVDGGTADCFKLDANREYLLKVLPKSSGIHGIQHEADLREFLIASGFPTVPIVRTKDGAGIAIIGDYIVQIQHFVHGRTFTTNSLDASQMLSLSDSLASCCIHIKAAKGLRSFHEESWFRRGRCQKVLSQLEVMISSNMLANHKSSEELNSLLRKKHELVTQVATLNLDTRHFTRSGIHGDYSCLQLVEENNGPFIVVDFVNAGIAPVSWELIRSFCISAKSCKSATLNGSEFSYFVARFVQQFPLDTYDLKKMVDLYLFQLTRSNFGLWQAYQSGFQDEAAVRLGIWRTELAFHLAQNRNDLICEIQDVLH